MRKRREKQINLYLGYYNLIYVITVHTDNICDSDRKIIIRSPRSDILIFYLSKLNN